MRPPSGSPGSADAAGPAAAESLTPGSGGQRSPASLAEALAAGPVVLDGGLATQLERAGYDISGSLWSASLLRSRPQAALQAHRAYFDAGAQVATTASYQATFEGFAAAGVDAQQVRHLLRRSVELARLACEGRDGRWVAASVGPYGAMLADGSEYTGGYARRGAAAALDVRQLAAWHRPRLEALAEAAPDVLACETLPCAAEAEALISEVSRLGVPAWICLTTVTGPDGRVRTRLGEEAQNVFALARGVDAVIAVGVNCTDPQGVRAAAQVAAAASGKPVVVYPNSGETWDAQRRRWSGSPDFAVADIGGWVASGARLIGGCCRVGPEQIAAISRALGR